MWYDAAGIWLALIGWSAAGDCTSSPCPVHRMDRNRQREPVCILLVQNSRFVDPGSTSASIPNLASRALSLCLQRLSADWQARYYHPIIMVETFVDRESYQATATSLGFGTAWATVPDSKRVAQGLYSGTTGPKSSG